MKIRVGFEMLYDFPQPTPMIIVLGTHFTRASDVIVPDFLTTDPAVEIRPYHRFWDMLLASLRQVRRSHRSIHCWHGHAACRSALPRKRFSPLTGTVMRPPASRLSGVRSGGALC